jgi:hypothetical protein
MTKVRVHSKVAEQAPAKNPKAQASKKPWTNAQKVTITLAVISLVGVTITAVFGNLDKFSKDEGSKNQTDALLALNEHHKAESERTLADAEASLSEALKRVEDDKALTIETKRANAVAAAKAKSIIETERIKILSTYQRLNDSIQDGNTLKTAIYQNQLKSELLNVQRKFYKTVGECQLRESAKMFAQAASGPRGKLIINRPLHSPGIGHRCIEATRRNWPGIAPLVRVRKRSSSLASKSQTFSNNSRHPRCSAAC